MTEVIGSGDPHGRSLKADWSARSTFTLCLTSPVGHGETIYLHEVFGLLKGRNLCSDFQAPVGHPTATCWPTSKLVDFTEWYWLVLPTVYERLIVRNDCL